MSLTVPCQPRQICAAVPTCVTDSEEEAENARIRERVESAFRDSSGRLRLWLNDHRATRIPDDVGRITTLRELYCTSAPKIICIPETIAKLESLQILDISHCSIRQLPESLITLPRLRELDASHNELESFFWDPDCLGASLEFLDISNNKIKFFSFVVRSVFVSIRERSQRLTAAQLYQRESVHIEKNSFWKVGDANFDDWKMLSIPMKSPLSDLLPDLVDHCCVCRKQVVVGRPFVYVKFDQWKVTAREKQNEQVQREEFQRVPFFYPYCSAECCIALHSVHEVR